jgi:EAL and modified HD-GYP domain-containing signal transduction protein
MDMMNTNLATKASTKPEPSLCRQHLGRIMEIVQTSGNADNAAIEVKHDPVLLYQFMTHLRSNGTGYKHDCAPHAQSLIQFRTQEFQDWFDNMAETELQDVSAAVSKNAIVRGRFVELIGKSMFGELHADALFITGIFSVLDILLGRPMRTLLDTICVSEEMYEALLYRKGRYAQLLFLAKAIEDANEQRIDDLQAALSIPIETVYETYNAALEWAEGK